MRIVAYAPDLMDQSRIRAAAAALPDPKSRTRDKPWSQDPTVRRGTRVGGDEPVDVAAREVVFVRRIEALAGESAGADLVVVDLSRPGVLGAVGSIETRTVGFGSHVEPEMLAAARAAGCDEVLPRSQFFRRLTTLLA